jgi:hypothetical protein
VILSPLLNDPSNRLRRSLIEMMMQTDYETALPLVRPLLRDNAISVREAALAAISKWHDKVSVEDVRHIAYNDPNPFVRPQAVITLTSLLGQDALPDLIDLSGDLNIHVRRSVAQSLVEMDYLTSAGKAALIRLAADGDTAEFARAALETHDLTSVHPLPKEDKPMKVPFPQHLYEDADSLLYLLKAWQDSLLEMQSDFTLEELSEVDQALSTLIVNLHEAGHWSA